MDKEEIAMSHGSTLTSSDFPKPTNCEGGAQFLTKRKMESNTEFEQLIRSVSDSGKVSPRQATATRPDPLGSDDSEVHEASDQKTEEKEDIGISRKRLIRNRQNYSERYQQDSSATKCSNPNCSFVSRRDLGRLTRMKYLSEAGNYCEGCCVAIRNKWTCPHCNSIYTDPAHSQGKDLFTWIKCDNKKCERWTHLQCEEKITLQDLKHCVNDSSIKFYCSDCSENLKPIESPSCNKKKPELPPLKSPEPILGPIITDKAELKSLLSTVNKFDQCTSYSYLYPFSEGFQFITKLAQESRLSINLREHDHPAA